MAQTKGASNVPSGLVSCDGGSFSVTFHRDTSFPAVGARSGQRCFKRTAADLFTTFPFFHSFARAVVFSWGNRLAQYLPT